MSINLSKSRREKMIQALKQMREMINNNPFMLQQISEIENELNKKKYGLVWEEHEEKVDVEIKSKIPVFIEDKELEIKTDVSKPINFLIEGDNLHSLYLLEKTHKEMIDVIYIDPPYNTGGKDFIYDDNYVNVEDTFRHSKWISFMEKRLKLVKKLLKNTGVIFISIDNNEFAQLKLLCDEIFGEENFENFVWKKKGGAGNTEKIVGTLTEYILCYFKKKQKNILNYRNIHREYKYKDDFGEYNLEGIEKTNLGVYERKTMMFPIIDPKTNQEFMPSKNKRWTIGKDKVDYLIKNNKIVFDYKKNKVYVIKRREDSNNTLNVYYNLLLEYGSLKTAKTEMEKLFGTREIFDTPKPLALINHLLEISSKNDSIVLDFFAGSGTTGQAVLELNKRDNGQRQFILCTDNENNICKDITYQRIKKVIEGYDDNKPIQSNLKYYKTNYINRFNHANKDYYITLELSKYIKELVQLENAIDESDSKIKIIFTDKELDEFLSNKSQMNECKILYLDRNAMIDGEHETELEENNIKLCYIPEYYFENEIMEAEEW